MSNEAMLFLNFNRADLNRLNKIYPAIKPVFPKIVKLVIERIGANPKLVGVMKSQSLSAEMAQAVFETWIDQVFTSNYESGFSQLSYKIAATHERVGINPKYVTMTMGMFIIAIDYALSKMIDDRMAIFAYSYSIKKALILNLTMMTQSYEDIKRSKVMESLNSM